MPTEGILCSARAAARPLFIIATVLATAFPLQAQIRSLYAPVLEDDTHANMEIVLVNPSQGEAQVTLTARSYQGVIIQGKDMTNPVMLTLPSNNRRAQRV